MAHIEQSYALTNVVMARDYAHQMLHYMPIIAICTHLALHFHIEAAWNTQQRAPFSPGSQHDNRVKLSCGANNASESLTEPIAVLDYRSISRGSKLSGQSNTLRWEARRQKPR
jgi:hypothetical protein